MTTTKFNRKSRSHAAARCSVGRMVVRLARSLTFSYPIPSYTLADEKNGLITDHCGGPLIISTARDRLAGEPKKRPRSNRAAVAFSNSLITKRSPDRMTIDKSCPQFGRRHGSLDQSAYQPATRGSISPSNVEGELSISPFPKHGRRRTPCVPGRTSRNRRSLTVSEMTTKFSKIPMGSQLEEAAISLTV